MNTTKPVENAFVRLETYDPIVTTGGAYPSTHTDENGNYTFNIGSNFPEQVTVRVYFMNDDIYVRGYETVHSDHVTAMKMPAGMRPPFYMMGDEFRNMNLNYTTSQDENKYAKIFMMANNAHEFASNNGYDPPAVNIKYHAETSLVYDVTVSVESSFYWPFANNSFDWTKASYFAPILLLSGLEAQISSNTIYLTEDIADTKCRTTVFHEFGHHVMKHLRNGNWPISLWEYETGGESPTHSWNEYDQSNKLAFVEGWANFYGSAVESWYYGNPYIGRYLNNGTTYPDLFENAHSYYENSFNISNVISGFNNEITVGAAYFDFYDTENSGDADGFQMSLSDLFDLFDYEDSNTYNYFMRLYRNQVRADRGEIVDFLDNLKMTLTLPTPSAPTNFDFSGLDANDHPKFTWAPNQEPDLAGYNIYKRKPMSTGPVVKLNSSLITSETYTDVTEVIRIYEGIVCEYWVKAVNFNDEESTSSNIDHIQVDWMFKRMAEDGIEFLNQVPTEYGLSEAYPNPFNPSTNITFGLPEQSEVSLKVYNVQGKEVATLANNIYNSGLHKVRFDGNQLASGIYVCNLTAKSTTSSNFTNQVKRLLLVK